MYNPSEIDYGQKVGEEMQVVVHYPKSTNAQQVLSQKAAEVHVQSIMNQINKLNLSKENAELLIKMMYEKIKQVSSYIQHKNKDGA